MLSQEAFQFLITDGSIFCYFGEKQFDKLIHSKYDLNFNLLFFISLLPFSANVYRTLHTRATCRLD